MYGAECLQVDLKALGFDEVQIRAIDENTKYVILSQFEIQSGRFVGQIVDIGFLANPDYPNSVSSSLHVRSNPHLFDYQNEPSVRNIIQSPLGDEWRYWSLNFAEHWDVTLGARRLLSLVNEVFNRA